MVLELWPSVHSVDTYLRTITKFTKKQCRQAEAFSVGTKRKKGLDVLHFRIIRALTFSWIQSLGRAEEQVELEVSLTWPRPFPRYWRISEED